MENRIEAGKCICCSTPIYYSLVGDSTYVGLLDDGGFINLSFGFGSRHDEIHGHTLSSVICDDCAERKFKGGEIVKRTHLHQEVINQLKTIADCHFSLSVLGREDVLEDVDTKLLAALSMTSEEFRKEYLGEPEMIEE